MDILAAIFAYLVCISGLVAGLAMSFVVFFSAPGEFSPSPPSQAVAMVAKSSHAGARPGAPIETVAKTAAKTAPAAVPPVAIDAPQKPLISQAHLRRLAERERARQLAYREHSSFESRFLHFDD